MNNQSVGNCFKVARVLVTVLLGPLVT